MKYILTQCHLIIDGNRQYLDGGLLIEDARIKEVFEQSNKINEIDKDYKVIDLKGSLVMPGFFDTHTHGGSGICFDDADNSQMDKVSEDFLKDGTTSYLASLSYDLGKEGFLKQLERLESYESKTSRFVGIHTEGPFLSKKHIGVGDGKQFLKPDIELVRQFLNTSHKIKQMTIAYEEDGAKQIGQLLHDNNIRVMCGHSDAVYEDLDENVDGFTHLFNAMRSYHHRDKTLVNCAFDNKWYCELIADGNHIHRDVLKLVINNIDRHKIMLVSDSSIARNLPDGEYEFMSKRCFKKGTTFISDDNHFAGSVVSINDEMKVLYELGANYNDLLLYSSLNAFRFYGLDKQFGTIEKGKYADIVVMDDDLNIKNVMVEGEFIYA